MKRHFSHLFLALSFAMIQCIAPLAHAHTGDSVERGIHLPEAEAEARIIEEDTLQCCIAEAGESVAVVVSQGCKRAKDPRANAAQAVFMAATVVPAMMEADVSPVPEIRRDARALPSPPFRTPYAQAPPASLEL